MDGKIPPSDHDDGREDMWGIKRRDRRWFQVMTLIGGTAGSIVLTWLEVRYGAGGTTPNVLVRNILLGIGASFIAAGFISWELLHVKELFMAIADWIREATERRRQRLRDEGRREGLQEGQMEGLKQALKERLPQAREEGRREGLQEGRQQGREEMRREMLAQSGDSPNEDAVAESLGPSSNGDRRNAYLAGYEDAQRGNPLSSHNDAYVNGYSDAQRGHPLNPPPNGQQSDAHQSK